jgi:hypothetical protein
MHTTDVMLSPEEEETDLPETVSLRRRPDTGVALTWMIGALYAASFFLPATKTMPGYMAFLCSVVFVIGIPMWGANPVFWFGLYHLARGSYREASRAGTLAVVLALSECWMFGDDLSYGYFVWVCSMGILALTGLFTEVDDQRRAWPTSAAWRSDGEGTRIASRFRR